MFISVSLIMVVPITYVVRMTLSVADILVGLIIGTPLNYTYLYSYACIGSGESTTGYCIPHNRQLSSQLKQHELSRKRAISNHTS